MGLECDSRSRRLFPAAAGIEALARNIPEPRTAESYHWVTGFCNVEPSLRCRINKTPSRRKLREESLTAETTPVLKAQLSIGLTT